LSRGSHHRDRQRRGVFRACMLRAPRATACQLCARAAASLTSLSWSGGDVDYGTIRQPSADHRTHDRLGST
jgi:hypothetical protein